MKCSPGLASGIEEDANCEREEGNQGSGSDEACALFVAYRKNERQALENREDESSRFVEGHLNAKASFTSPPKLN